MKPHSQHVFPWVIAQAAGLFTICALQARRICVVTLLECRRDELLERAILVPELHGRASRESGRMQRLGEIACELLRK